ncbi:hypothetical protein [Nocardiopsis algeriensis]|uniref:Uncharacterized protein n=1 Tax=Nocardiopsis algeriensis TaxID=1478215 RepID=A0A841IY47_9ACTN|nr:hypothetical protein [Nocardiopsis algeriensis]MBB6122206.1 hypothetical protein [Nocardiopsis algeriensis]
MLTIAQISEATGATRADIVRVLRGQSSSTTHDWEIAHAIEAAGGRKAAELMLTAGREHMIATIWGDSGASAEAPTQTNPNAVYDPEVTVYPEDTAPDGPNRISPHHPHGDDQAQDEPEVEDRAAAEELAAEVHADLAEVLDDPAAGIDGATAASRITAAWTTPAEARQVLLRVLQTAPRTRGQIALHTTVLAA